MPFAGHTLATLLPLLGVSFAVSLAASRLVIALAPRLRLLDTPAHRKIHKLPVAYGGGLAILLGLLASLGLHLAAAGDSLAPAQRTKVGFVLGATTLAALLGFLDDRYQLRPRHKLLWEAAIAGVFVLFAYRFHALKLPGLEPIDLYYLAVPFTMFWILSVVNAVNLIDGADGLAAAVVAASLAMSGLTARVLGDRALLVLAACGIGATLGFLVFNWRPARIYLGDAGSLGLGMFTATSLVTIGQDSMAVFGQSGPSEVFRNQVPLLTLLVAYPVLEITLSVLRRLLAGKAIGSADRAHIHHRLLDSGWGPRAISLLAVLLTLLCGGFAIYTLNGLQGRATWFLTAACVITGVGLHYCGYLHAFHPSRLRGTRPRYLAVSHFVGMQRARLELARSLDEVLRILDQTALELGVRHYALVLGAEVGESTPDREGEPTRREIAWLRPAGARGAYLDFGEGATRGERGVVHTETVELPDRQGRASFTFDAREGSADLAVEYRVLMSDFMAQALASARVLRDRSDAPAGVAYRAGANANLR
jgi:UDP-GlcNAc:undecaprenyl-phosphate GlcNAc-1-phosphate transferase